ncbi:MAG: hypothetical protein D6722_05670, partial [Bacteroidetes bacterium]
LGSAGLILALGLVTLAFFQAPIDLSTIPDLDAYLAGLGAGELAELQGAFGNVLYYLCAYISFFALSQGAVIWVFISEIFPNEVRGYGQSLGSFTHWLLAALITNLFPVALGKFGGGPIFLFFTLMMVLQLGYVFFFMPETRGRTLEEIGIAMTSGRKA